MESWEQTLADLASERGAALKRHAFLLCGDEAQADVTPDPADQVSDRDAMLTALRSLSPRQRACMVLRYYEDLPVAEVAAVLGVGEGTVKRYLSEAMSHVATRLSSAGSG